MAHQQYCEQVKHNGRIAFRKYKHINAVRKRIFNLAKNSRLRAKRVSSRTPKQTIKIDLSRRTPAQIKVGEIFIDDIEEFRKVRSLRAATLPSLVPKRLPEKIFKYGVASILGNKGVFQDWGGETNDLFSSYVTIKGRRRSAAFAFKGPGTSAPLTLRKMGKQGNQIQRLFVNAADIFIVQFEGKIEEDINESMLTHAIRKSHETRREILYGIIGLEDSHRLRVKYSSNFSSANIPEDDE